MIISIVPYQTVEAKDGLMVLAIANNNQFKNFCNFAGLGKISKNEKYKTNSLRVLNRKSLNAIIKKTIKKKDISYWVKGLINVNVPCGPINNIEQVFKDPQVIFRKMAVDIKHKNKKIKIVGSPIKLNKSPIIYKKSPPTLGEDTVSVLKKFLKLNKSRIVDLKKKNII